MKRVAVAIAASLLAAAADAQAPGAYEQAVTARMAGEHDRARALLQQVVAAEPGNSDAWLQLGLALLGLGRLDEAERALRRTLEIAPDYPDARIGLARVAQRRGDRQAALAALEPVSPTNGEAGALRAELRAGRAGPVGTRTRVDIDFSHSDLAGDRPNWQEGSIQLRHRATPTTGIGVGLEVSRRFGLTDAYGEFRLDQRLSEAATIYATLGGAPDADFRPELQVGLGGSFRVRPGRNPTLLSLDARQARFPSGDIQTLNPGVEQYLAGGRVWLTARWINIFDEGGRHESGWLARGDVQASERLRLFLGAADAPDTSEGVVTETLSLFGGLAYDLSDRRTLRLSAAHEDRRGGGDRFQLAIGLGLGF